MKVNRFVLIGVILFNVVLLYGCFNIFSPLFSDPKDQDLSGLWDINFLVEMGNYYSDIGDYENARKFYSRALEINPTNADALIGIANCEFFLVFPRTNIMGFYEEISSNYNQYTNTYDFIQVYLTNEKFQRVSHIISRNLYIVVSGQSDKKYLTNDDNLHFSFAIFNKVNSFFRVFDFNGDGRVGMDDLTYELIKTNELSVELLNTLLFNGESVNKSMSLYFSEGRKSLNSLIFITNKFSSKESSIEVQILKAFVELDLQITNIYTNFMRSYNFYSSMYNRIVSLLTNNGIPLGYATNIDRLTNSLSIQNYSTFDNADITNILTTDNTDAWDILTNYIDLNRLTN